ncbi:MAG: alpha/beta fold hydrolase [Candidatus Thiodiazotropha endolucinida]|nr:alpha/beta fold hydrolase [Candidatus Thiodiazotropha taylori]MCW4316033.1 alpha/beta fold hydrolase [Candidatus Thiodiazotropha taylori]
MIVYLHGLNSAGSSGKAAFLRQALPGIDVISPTYPAHSADLAVARLSDQLNRLLTERGRPDEPRLLVGSSMGGFYGAWLAERLGFHHLLMINPALQPWQLLKQVVGWQLNEALNQGYFLSSRMVSDTRRYHTPVEVLAVPTTVLVDKGDELIDYRLAQEVYGDRVTMHCFEGGSHTFEHMQEAAAIIEQIHQSVL